MKKYIAECVGTAALVFIGCGAVTLGGQGLALGGAAPANVLATLPIAFAFGIGVIAMAYGIGPISGCHINPAVSAGVWAAGRMSTTDLIGYWAAQCVGGIIGAIVLYVILSGRTAGYDIAQVGLGQNGWSAYSTGSAAIAEFVGTFLFLVAILGATSKAGVGPASGVAIGLTLVGIHIVLIPVTGTSVNPARSLGPALFVGGKAMAQLWLFIVMPILGGLAAGYLFRGKLLED